MKIQEILDTFESWEDAGRLIEEQHHTIATLTEENEMYEGMKEGVTIRIQDLEATIRRLRDEDLEKNAEIIRLNYAVLDAHKESS